MSNKGFVLTALDGSNPLAFLAALGTLRLLSLYEPSTRVTLKWVRQGVWLPELHGFNETQDVLCDRLQNAARKYLPTEAFSELLGKNITVDEGTFAKFVRIAYESAQTGERIMGDFAVAFGSEICKQERKERIEYTDFCFITGSGHQHFLGTMEGLKENVSAAHIRGALFGPWTKNKGFSMRWDPADAAEYAFRWGDPSVEGASSVWGANLLAVHALPLFPSQPTENGLHTTGFCDGDRGRWPEFSWPIWRDSIGVDTIRSLVSMKEFVSSEDKLDHRALRAMGIEEVYRAPRVRIGQGANFKVSFRPAHAA